MNVGGTARYIELLLENIPNNMLATGHVQGSEIEDKCVQKLKTIRIQHMGRKISPLNDLRACLEVRKVIKDLKPQIIHTHTFKAGFIGRLVGGGFKRVHTYHGHLFDDESFSKFEKKVITSVEKIMASRTDLLISVGEEVGEKLREEGIGVEQNWLSIPPGVRQIGKLDRHQARAVLGLPKNGILIGWMARMTEVKNPHLLLEVAEKLKGFNFVMAGGGNLLSEIQGKAPPNVAVIGWTDALTFWSAVDLAVSTSQNEGMPISLIEAQLAGIPVIATDVGSTSEVVENGITGAVTSNKPDEIADEIKSLIEDREKFRSMSYASKIRAEKEFSVEKMIGAHKTAYSQLIN
jgi:glycosyltransferase involved in cell wall biosynthesis